MPEVNANSVVDPAQAPLSAASDLGLHYLPMSHFWDTRHKWVNTNSVETDQDGSGQSNVHHGKFLYNFDPLKPHFYIVKLGFTGV